MHRRSPLAIVRPCLAGFVSSVLVLSCLMARGETLSEDEARQIIRTRIEDEKRGVGIVVGLLDSQGPRVIAHGRTSTEGGREVNGKTEFEIGSITKVFTSLLLAEAVKRKQVALDDPVAKYLPPEIKLPASAQRQITLLDLATHRSGLPSFPENFQPKDGGNPYAGLTVGQLYAFAATSRLKSEIGSQYAYSNLGGALLGQAMANRAQTSYEALVVDDICTPLGMNDTRISLPPAQRARMAQPHDRGLAPAQNWDLGAFAGAGGLCSTADDLLKFLAANLDTSKGPLAGAVSLTQEVRKDAGGSANDIALGWHINRVHIPPIIWHNGGTGGYRSFIGFDAINGLGIVVLSNTANPVEDIGLHLLNAQFELSPQTPQREAIKIRPAVAETCVGKYAFGPAASLTFSREGNRFFTQLTGQDRLEVYPESEVDFFPTVVDALISFHKDSGGRVTSLTLRQKGIPDQLAQRVP